MQRKETNQEQRLGSGAAGREEPERLVFGLCRGCPMPASEKRAEANWSSRVQRLWPEAGWASTDEALEAGSWQDA